jgi:hypothetical protein
VSILTALDEHYFQNAEKGRTSPHATLYVKQYNDRRILGKPTCRPAARLHALFGYYA